jgi:hypothetical protein
MADNVTANSGSGGAVFATDDDGTAHHPYCKIEWGANNTFTKVDTGASAIPIQDGGNSITTDWAGTAPPIGAGVEATALRVTLATDSTGVVSIDDNGGTLTVDNAALSVVGGGVEASALRVTLASDSTGTLTVDNAGTFAVQATLTAETTKVIGTVNVAAAQTIAVTNAGTFATQSTLQAGTAEIGKLAAGVAEIGNVKNSGTFAVQATLQAGTAGIGKLTANSGVDIGDVDVTSISAGSNLIGDVGISGARTSGGTTIFRSIDLDESEEEVKATAGQIYWIHAMNLAATKRYLKVYNATAASVTVGTTTPVLTFPLPTTGDTNGAGFMFAVPNGVAFGTAITVAATTGIADNDTGAPGANEVTVNIGYA